jgi:surface carbohydrate biosynthesis protein
MIGPRRWLFLPIEVKVRELDANALLAFEAAERGWGVLVGGPGLSTSDRLPKGLLIRKKITPGYARVAIEHARARGWKVASWCEEGLVYASAEVYGRRKVDVEAYRLLDRYFAWGQQQANDMVETMGCPPETMAVTGHPRVDLLREDRRGLFSARADEIRARYGSFILINTKFPQSNNAGGVDIERQLTKWRGKGKVRSAESEADERRRFAFQAAVFPRFMELVESLSRRFPATRIVIRPHPSENHQPWHDRAADLPNVAVVFEGGVVEWLLAADVCVHNNCTTAVESYVLGKPAVAYRPIRDEQAEYFLPNALSIPASTLDEVSALVEQALDGRPVEAGTDRAERAVIASRYMANLEGPTACDRILDDLDRIDVPVASLPDTRGVRIQRWLGALRGWNESDRRRRAAKRERFPPIVPGELEARLHAARECAARFSDVRIRALEGGVHCVYADS